jgi:hypothetical protein
MKMKIVSPYFPDTLAGAGWSGDLASFRWAMSWSMRPRGAKLVAIKAKTATTKAIIKTP